MRDVHLIDAGIVTEQRFAGLAEAPSALAPAMTVALWPTRHIEIRIAPRESRLAEARAGCRQLAETVADSLREGALPVVVGGECTVVAGTIPAAVVAEPDLMLVYLDAHGDFNTMATTPSHYVAGMGLAHVCGRQVGSLLWPGARPIEDDRAVLVGGRELDPGEATNLSESRVARVAFDAEKDGTPELVALAARQPLWVHLDVDVVDPGEMPAVILPAPGGPPLSAVSGALAAIAVAGDVRGVEVCGYDPRKDPDSRLPPVIAGLAAAAARVAAPAKKKRTRRAG